jgi:tetratricopeptide (TPR) repeat protein
MDFAFVFPPAWAPYVPSYAMALLKTSARAAGHRLLGFDLNIDLHNATDASERSLWQDDHAPFWRDDAQLVPFMEKHRSFLSDYADRVAATGVKLCAFSVNSASSSFARKFAAILHERAPEIFILFGGPDCFRSETGLRMLEHPAVSAICVGEGDRALPEFLTQFETDPARPARVRGFVVKDAAGGLIDCGDPELILDLDSVAAADYSDMDLTRYTGKARVCTMTSRGCILRCAYCSEGENFLRYRYRSAERLVDEIDAHVHLLARIFPDTVPMVTFADSLFNGRPEVLERFCDLVVARGLHFYWGGMALLRKEMTPELLAKMYAAGCREIMWGLESGSEAVLKLMRKKLFTPTLASEIIRNTHRAGIQQYTNIIVGFPGETEEMFHDSAAFLLKHRRYFMRVGLPLMTIRPNSHVFRHFRDFGVAAPESERWVSTDGRNNYALRMARHNLLAAIVGEKLFSQGRYGEEAGDADDDPADASPAPSAPGIAGRARTLREQRIAADLPQYAQARRLLDRGDVAGGAEILIRLAATETLLWNVYDDLGVLAQNNGDADGARVFYEQALALDSDACPAMEHLAALLTVLGDRDGAIRLHGRILRANPRHPGAQAAVREALTRTDDAATLAWNELVAGLGAGTDCAGALPDNLLARPAASATHDAKATR